jgi:membrane-associated phospholipid phosphatase
MLDSRGGINIKAVKSRVCYVILFLLVISPAVIFASDTNQDTTFTFHQFTNSVKTDYNNFYSTNRLIRMSFVFAGGALVANTALDQNIQNWYQEHVRTSRTEDISKAAKFFGEGKYMIPLSFASAVVGTYFVKIPVIGSWGRYTFRSYLVGGPALVVLQRLTGGSRPGERKEDSRWNPLKDDNGVSGHAFVGAVPFLVLAHMSEQKPLLKYLFYTASFSPALSRINDNMHYPSQAALGWYLAWEATGSVRETTGKQKNLSVVPVIGNDSFLVYLQLRW